jgi:hypothetical protein
MPELVVVQLKEDLNGKLCFPVSVFVNPFRDVFIVIDISADHPFSPCSDQEFPLS